MTTASAQAIENLKHEIEREAQNFQKKSQDLKRKQDEVTRKKQELQKLEAEANVLHTEVQRHVQQRAHNENELRKMQQDLEQAIRQRR